MILPALPMIPGFTISGVLPPFDAEQGPTNPGAMSPYPAAMSEVATRFGGSETRRAILRGLLEYRAAVRAAGFVRGFQWLDGSFLEDVELVRRRPPGDVDLVTFAQRPKNFSDDEWREFVGLRASLFDPQEAKSLYRCDAYFVDLNLKPEILVSYTRYWFGLFSHQRATNLWKGMLEVPLDSDDLVAQGMLAEEDA
ncbi:MAG: hypothetical protein WCF44_03760 [Candidatus Methylophosphatis roskildensis]